MPITVVEMIVCVSPGMTIAQAAIEMCDLSRAHKVPVQGEFNGFILAVTPETTAYECVDKYNRWNTAGPPT